MPTLRANVERAAGSTTRCVCSALASNTATNGVCDAQTGTRLGLVLGLYAVDL
jgi:hypothetical protein